jgi:signal transduction histidine kinase
MAYSSFYLVLSGVMIGFIFMTIFYNLFIYVYIKERSFLYYAIMQIFMTPILIYHSKIIPWNWYIYAYLSIFASIFAILFTRSFLNTKHYLPRIDKVLKFYLSVLLVDFINLLLTGHSFSLTYNLYSACGLIYLLIGYLRIRQGSIPARFFLIGWVFFIGTLLYVDIFKTTEGSIFLFGPPLEALFLSMALAYHWKIMHKEKEEQAQLLIHQTKLASMGEMVGNISHQLKQPLTYLSFNFMNLKEASKQNLLDDAYLNKKLNRATEQLEFMSQTIDNFRDFYLPNKEKKLFSLKETFLETFEIVKPQFKEESIQMFITVKEEGFIVSCKSEYKQVILNLLNNAKEAFQKNKTSNPLLKITVEKNAITISDNAGGIPQNIFSRIYDPYFTTKKGNSGIGLYMSKMIVEKSMEGCLEAENIEEGAVFKISF